MVVCIYFNAFLVLKDHESEGLLHKAEIFIFSISDIGYIPFLLVDKAIILRYKGSLVALGVVPLFNLEVVTLAFDSDILFQFTFSVSYDP